MGVMQDTPWTLTGKSRFSQKKRLFGSTLTVEVEETAVFSEDPQCSGFWESFTKTRWREIEVADLDKISITIDTTK